MGNIQINLSDKWLYTLIIIGIFVVVAVGVNAFGTNNPPVFGHSIGELGSPAGCLDGQVLTWGAGSWACNSVTASGVLPSGIGPGTFLGGGDYIFPSGSMLKVTDAPVASNDVVTKGYVDALGGGTGGGMRKYYLTKTTHTGSEALTACASGYHMANIYEMIPGNLQYDITNTNALVTDDSGYGPVSRIPGWVRMGHTATGDANSGNCDGWTRGTSTSYGRVAQLYSYAITPYNTAPWNVGGSRCDTPRSVWCLEDY